MSKTKQNTILRRLRRIVVVLGVLFVLPIVTFILLYRFTPVIDESVESIVNHFSGDNLEIRFSGLEGNLLGTLRINDLLIVTGRDSIQVPRIELDYDLLDIVNGRYFVDRAVISRPLAAFHQKPPDTTAVSTAVDSLIVDIVTSLPSIRLEQLLLEEGTFLFRGDSVTQRFDNIDIELTARALDEQIVVEPHYVRAYWPNRDIALRNLTFKLIGNRNRLTLNQLQARLDNTDLIGHGEIEFEPDFRILMFLDTTQVDLDIVAKFTNDFPFKAGYARLYGTYIGTVAEFDGEIYADARMDDLRVRELSARYKRDGRGFRLEDIRFNSNVGRVSGSAYLSKRLKNRIDLKARNLDMRALGVVEDTMMINGQVALDFRNWRWETLEATGKIDLQNFRFGAIQVDAANAQIGIEDRNISIKPGSRVKLGPQATIALQGSLSADRQLGLSLSTETVNLDTLFARLGVPAVGGSGRISLETNGPVDNPSVSGRLEIDSLTAGNAIFYAIYGDFDVQRVVRDRLGQFNLELATSYIGDVFLTSGELKLEFRGNQIHLQPVSFYSEENAIINKGVVELVDGGVNVDISEFMVRYDTYAVSNDGPLQFSYVNDSLDVRNFRLKTGNQGELAVKGLYTSTGESAIGATVSGFPLLPLNQYIYWDQHTIAGVLDADAQYLGRQENPEVNVFVAVEDLNIDENRIGDLDGDFTLADSIFSINYFNFERDSASFLTINGRVDVKLVGRDSLVNLSQTPLDLNIVLENMRVDDYLFFYRSNLPIAGRLSGRLDLAGTMGDPIGNLELVGKNIRYGDYVFPSVNLNDTWIQRSGIELRDARIDFLDTDIFVKAEKPFLWNLDSLENIYQDKRFRLQAIIREDSLNFLNAVNSELDRLIGDINAELVLGGEWDAPQLRKAEIDVRDGTLYLSRLENGIQGLNVKGRMNGDILEFSRIEGSSPRLRESKNFLQSWFSKLQDAVVRREPSGQIVGKGNIDFTDVTRPRLDLTVSANKAYFNYFLENVEVLASTDHIRITGRDTININGDVLLRWGDMEVDFVESEKNLLLATTVREKPPFLKYNLDVTMLPDFHVRSADPLNDFDLTMEGELSIIQEPRSLLEIFGVLQISDGKYAVQGEEFTIESGTINFVNPKELPEINLYAVTQKHVDAVEDSRNPLTFELQVTGNVDEPDKTITIKDATGSIVFPDVKDQMALLVLGVPFSQLGSAGFLTKGGEVVTQALVNRIEREARSFTGLDEVRVDNAGAFFNSRLNEQSTLSLGKYLTSNLYLEYKSQLAGRVPTPQLSWEAGNQISLQYRLNRGLYLSTLLKKTEEGNEKVKFDISWQFDF